MRESTLLVIAASIGLTLAGVALAESHDRPTSQSDSAETDVPISSEVPFDRLMAQAMDRMHAAMAAIQPTGDPDRDFLRMMAPHHQGAIDMAKAILLYGKDPRVRNLAQGIIAEQKIEIRLMQSLLASGTGTAGDSAAPRRH